jgi:hypothetical protein
MWVVDRGTFFLYLDGKSMFCRSCREINEVIICVLDGAISDQIDAKLTRVEALHILQIPIIHPNKPAASVRIHLKIFRANIYHLEHNDKS